MVDQKINALLQMLLLFFFLFGFFEDILCRGKVYRTAIARKIISERLWSELELYSVGIVCWYSASGYQGAWRTLPKFLFDKTSLKEITINKASSKRFYTATYSKLDFNNSVSLDFATVHVSSQLFSFFKFYVGMILNQEKVALHVLSFCLY